jgi:hypothetical protein
VFQWFTNVHGNSVRHGRDKASNMPTPTPVPSIPTAADQFAAALSAPMPFIFAVFAVGVALFAGLLWAFRWRYDGVIEQLDAMIRLAAEENRIQKERENDLRALGAEFRTKLAELEEIETKQPTSHGKRVVEDLSKLSLTFDRRLDQLGQSNTATDEALRRGAAVTTGGGLPWQTDWQPSPRSPRNRAAFEPASNWDPRPPDEDNPPSATSKT